MDAVISLVMSDMVGRFISFLTNKYSNQTCLEEKVERLQRLLLRVHTVIEEADGRYITNCGMQVQLKMLAEAMYGGYHALDTFRYKRLEEGVEQVVSDSLALSFATRLNRSRRAIGITKNKVSNHQLQTALEKLEDVVANMTEFVIFLGGCKRMSCRPYDTYLYYDNFMFSRHVEKQQVINILMQNNPFGAPIVLLIIGGRKVGKKTLVAHVCNHEMIHSHFSSILHINGDDIWGINHEKFAPGRTLVVVEFRSDVENSEWLKFYSSLIHMDGGSKIIIISRLEKVARFGSVKPIHLNSLSDEEYNYLFKVLAFGSNNPMDYPKLGSIVEELATVLSGSLMGLNGFSNMMRNELNVQFWLHILKRMKRTMEYNFFIFGEHAKILFQKDSSIYIANFASSSTAPLRLAPPNSESDISKRKLPRVMVEDLIIGSTLIPTEFEVAWKSRLPPYTIISRPCFQERPQEIASPRKKHRKLDM